MRDSTPGSSRADSLPIACGQQQTVLLHGCSVSILETRAHSPCSPQRFRKRLSSECRQPLSLATAKEAAFVDSRSDRWSPRHDRRSVARRKQRQSFYRRRTRDAHAARPRSTITEAEGRVHASSAVARGLSGTRADVCLTPCLRVHTSFPLLCLCLFAVVAWFDELVSHCADGGRDALACAASATEEERSWRWSCLPR